MIQSAESVIIFTGITARRIVNFVTASLLASVVKNEKKAVIKSDRLVNPLTRNSNLNQTHFSKFIQKLYTKSN